MRELEYMAPFDRGKEAFLALRYLVLGKYPGNKYPIEIRSIAADTAYLSPFYQRDPVSVSICGHQYLGYRGFLADGAGRWIRSIRARTGERSTTWTGSACRQRFPNTPGSCASASTWTRSVRSWALT
jgi:hypothetical protein